LCGRGHVVIVVVASFLLAGSAAADNKDVARAAYQEGTRLYDLADFNRALEAFRTAYLNYEEPAFLFNIAQCYRQLGNRAEAIRFYKTYLRKVPDASNSEDVRRMIHGLGDGAAGQALPVPSPTAATTATPPPATLAMPPPATTSVTMTTGPSMTLRTAAAPVHAKPAYKRWWVWGIVGAVAAGAATGLALGLTQSSHEQSLPAVHVP
jgi:tetratricopeptide (TPR) repeat protein